jgi:predicted transcriptional regulator
MDELQLVRAAALIATSHAASKRISLDQVPSTTAALYAMLLDQWNIERFGRRPAVPIDQSVHPDYIVCLEDGEKRRMLRRYLRTKFDLSPSQYRARWGLPADYPLVAPNHSEMLKGRIK